MDAQKVVDEVCEELRKRYSPEEQIKVMEETRMNLRKEKLR